MAWVWIPFDGWSPGTARFGEGWSRVEDLAPIFDAFRPWHRFDAPDSGGVAFGPMVGSHAHLWSAGVGTSSYVPDSATIFTGSKTRLFTLDPETGVFTDVSRAANYGAAGEPAGWRFETIGNDIWATNHLDAMQRRTNNAGLFANGCTGAFLPQPRFIAAIREHLLGGNLSNAGRFQDELVWSDADNATDFNPPTGTSTSLAGSKRLTAIPGQITGLVGGQYGLAFKRRAIFYLEYTGTSQVLRPDVLSPHVGTPYGSSIINTKHGIFFFGTDGFYRINGLAAPEKLSPPGLDVTLLASLFASQPASLSAQSEDMQMRGFQFPGMPLIGWSFRLDWLLPGNDLLLVYNPLTNQWADVDGRGWIDVGEGTGVAISTIIERPYAENVWEALGAVTWDTSNSRYAPLHATKVWSPAAGMRWRPAGIDEAKHPLTQRMIKGVLPVFTKIDDVNITPAIRIEKLLDPFDDQSLSPDPGEIRTAAERDPHSGVYPFELAGKFFEVNVLCTDDEDFAHFAGLWVWEEALT